MNPEWPASYLWWGEPGYEREFVHVMREMERHFREKGWTKTKFEVFFNHKKRYKAFEWDGDETRFPEDLAYLKEYGRLLKTALPGGTPVQFVYRTDASWQMERQFKELAGIINFWVCGGGMFGWYAEAAPALKERGDIVWTYGGTPAIDKPAAAITTDMLRPWMLGVDGFVRWQTVMPGPDPWFKSGGGDETMVYPGDRFGIDGPIASVRLKLQRRTRFRIWRFSNRSAQPKATISCVPKRLGGSTGPRRRSGVRPGRPWPRRMCWSGPTRASVTQCARTGSRASWMRRRGSAFGGT